HAELRVLQFGRRDSLPQRQENYIEELLHEIDFRCLSGKTPLKIERGVLKQTCFHQIGLRDTKLFVGRLQIVIIQERDLYGRIRSEWTAQQRSDSGLRFGVFRASSIP